MVRADQHGFAQAKIVLDVGEATPVNPSQVGFYRTDRAPTLRTPPVEEDGHPLAAPERLLQGMVQVHMVPRHDQQAPCRSFSMRCLRPAPGDRHLSPRPS